MLTKNKKHVNRRWLNCTFVVMVALAVLIMLGVDGCPTPWPGPPLLLAPFDGAVFDQSRTITLEWTPVDQAVKYIYDIQILIGLTWITVLAGEVTTTTHTYESPAGKFRWRIKPINAQDLKGKWSNWWGFRVE